MEVSDQQVRELQDKVLTWFHEFGKWFPWRDIDDPYHVFLSECMLQQTQAHRVISYYERFIQEFPKVGDLASASRSTILSMWSGLGYNNRAIRLHQCAKIITERFGGEIPKDRETLLELPGIGTYTANAILAFAFNEDVPVIDTNIRRVLIYELGLSEDITHRRLEAVALQVLPKGRAREWYSALMDYGSSVLTAREAKISPKTKQPRFEGSTRQARGEVLRILLERKSVSYQELEQLLMREDLGEVIKGMEKDHLLHQEDGWVVLKEE
jgi:A/G-specific adenine glycosylase